MSDNLVSLQKAAPPVVSAPPIATPPVRSAPIDVQAIPITRRLTRDWLPSLAWTVKRTGQRGLIGLGLLAAAAIFLVSTHWPLADEVLSLRGDLVSATAAVSARAAQGTVIPSDDPRRLLDALPARVDMPKTLGVILVQADAAGLAMDSGKYDVAATRTGAITRYNVSFPVSGSYPAVRSFIDQVLKNVPSASLSELAIERKSIADGVVEANIRLTLYTRGTP